MSALRKAGVWLGLVEEDDDRAEDGLFDDEFGDDEEEFATPARPRSLSRTASRPTDHDRAIDRDRSIDRERDRERERREREVRIADQRNVERILRTEPEPRLPETRLTDRFERPADRSEPRASVRQLGRPAPVATPTPTPAPVTYPTQDNLALAPQVQLRERAVVNDEKSRRYQITTLHPTTYNEARAIGEHFRDGYPVIMNLTEMDESDAKRLVDFAAGLAFGMRGSMERVTNRVFLLSPPNIQVSAEDKARIAEGGFFDQG
jgi:cell division inhibitor SepF